MINSRSRWYIRPNSLTCQPNNCLLIPVNAKCPNRIWDDLFVPDKWHIATVAIVERQHFVLSWQSTGDTQLDGRTATFALLHVHWYRWHIHPPVMWAILVRSPPIYSEVYPVCAERNKTREKTNNDNKWNIMQNQCIGCVGARQVTSIVSSIFIVLWRNVAPDNSADLCVSVVDFLWKHRMRQCHFYDTAVNCM